MSRPTAGHGPTGASAARPGARFVVVFGAAPGRDGQPSAPMRDRVATAADALGRDPGLQALLTGGFARKRRHGASEAAMMETLLRARGIAPARIVLETQARDTLESAIFCGPLLRAHHAGADVRLISSRFHLPRCVALMWVMGWRPVALRPVQDERRIATARRWYWRLREIPAMIWDCGLAILYRLTGFRLRG